MSISLQVTAAVWAIAALFIKTCGLIRSALLVGFGDREGRGREARTAVLELETGFDANEIAGAGQAAEPDRVLC